MRPDIEKYLGMLEGWEAPREQKIQFINDLWHIMENFVDRAFGIHPVQQAVKKKPQTDGQDSCKRLDSALSKKPQEEGVRS